MAQTQTYSPDWDNIIAQNLQNWPQIGIETDEMTSDGLDLYCNDLMNNELWNLGFLENFNEEKTSSSDESPLNSPSLSSDSAFSNDSPLQTSDACFNVFDECTTSSSTAANKTDVPNVHFAINYGYISQNSVDKKHVKPNTLTFQNDLVSKPTQHNLHSNSVILPVVTDQLAILTNNSTVMESTTPTVYTINALPTNIISTSAHQIIVTTANTFGARSTKPSASYRTEPYPKIKPKLSVENCDFIETRSDASPFVPRRSSSTQISSTCSSVRPEMIGEEKPLEDEFSKMKKRQTRMIKNREYASLSRQKKKEHLDSLEERLRHYSEENEKLKRENSVLKLTVAKLQTENDVLRGKSEKVYSPTVQSRFLSSNSSKTVICALTLMFLCAVNLGPYLSYFYPRNLQPTSALQQSLTDVDGDFVGRKLLSISDGNMIDDEAFVQHEPDSIRSKRSSTTASFGNESNVDCVNYFNKSESIRLADELNRWAIRYESIRTKNFGKETSLKRSATSADEKKSKLKNAADRKHKPTLSKLSDLISSEQAVQQWFSDFDSFEFDSERVLARRNKHTNQNDLQIYFNDDDRYVRFLEALRRRDDTFYVVSFQREYLLLPALAHNRTARPRMSLVMPALLLNESMQPPPNHVAMMQIECEVTATSLLHLPENVVPKYLQQPKKAQSVNDERQKNRSSTSNKRSSLKNNSQSFNETSLK